MTFYLIAESQMNALYSDDPVIPPDAVQAFADAQELRHFFETATADHRAHCERAYEAAKKRGWEEGQRRASEEADARRADMILELERRFGDACERLEARCGSLALTIIRRLAQDLPKADLIASLAAKAAEDLSDEAPLTIITHPAQRDLVEQHLRGKGVSVKVIDDPDIGEMDCRLRSRFGDVDASLDVQLAAIEQSFLKGEVSPP